MTINSDIDKLFKEGLSSYTESPPSFVWEEVEHSLNRKRYKKRRNLWYSAAAVVALLISFGAGYMFTDFNNEPLIANNTPVIDEVPGVQEELPAVNEAESVNNNNSQEVLQSAVANTTGTQQEPKIKKSNQNQKVKKVSSSGTLLPPMFASEAVVTEVEAEEPKVVSALVNSNVESNRLTPIPAEAIAFNAPKGFDEIKYNALAYESRTTPQTFTIKKETKKQNWQVGINASPLVSYRDVYEANAQALASVNNLSSLGQEYKNEKPLVAYAAGVDVGYKISKRFNIQSGFYMSEIGQISENVDLNTVATFNNEVYSSYSINTSAGNIVVQGSPNDMIKIIDPGVLEQEVVAAPTMPRFADVQEETQVQADFVQTFDYYEIPVVLNYKLIDRKFAVDLSGGLSANIMYKNTSYLQDNNTRYELDADVEGLNTFSYAGTFGVGFAYPIVKSLEIKFNPTFRYSLSPLNSNGTVYPYSFGLFTGIKYSF